MQQSPAEDIGSKSGNNQTLSYLHDINANIGTTDANDEQKINLEESKNQENKHEPEENHGQENNDIAQKNDEERLKSPKIEDNHESKPDKGDQNNEISQDKEKKSDFNEDKPKLTQELPKLNEENLTLIGTQPVLAGENPKSNEENLLINGEKSRSDLKEAISVEEIREGKSNDKKVKKEKIENCPEGHKLIKLEELLQITKYQDRYVNNEFYCSICKKQNIPSSIGVYHCDICPYDICYSCNTKIKENSKSEDKNKDKVIAMEKDESNRTIEKDKIIEKVEEKVEKKVEEKVEQKDKTIEKVNTIESEPKNEPENNKQMNIETSSKENTDKETCSNGHKLIKLLDILSITKHENTYPNNHFRCAKCKIRRDSTKYESNHCEICPYDLCTHCLKGHEFLLTHDLAEFSEDPRYYENTYDCNVCMIDYECTQKEGAYHCEECLYDVCPSCFKDLYSE